MPIHEIFLRGSVAVLLSFAAGCVAPDEPTAGGQNEIRFGENVTDEVHPPAPAFVTVDMINTKDPLYFSGVWKTSRMVLTSGHELYKLKKRIESDVKQDGILIARPKDASRPLAVTSTSCFLEQEQNKCEFAIHPDLISYLESPDSTAATVPPDVGLILFESEQLEPVTLSDYPSLDQDDGQEELPSTVDVIGRSEGHQDEARGALLTNHEVWQQSIKIKQAESPLWQEYYQADFPSVCGWNPSYPVLQPWDAGGPLLFKDSRGKVHVAGLASSMASSLFPSRSSARDRFVKLTPAVKGWIVKKILKHNASGTPRP